MELIQFKILNTAIERTLNKELSDMGLTYTQATVIRYLKRNMDRDICQKDIEYSLGLTHPTVSSILSRMEESGMVVTEPMLSDHRYKKIMLTEKAVGSFGCIHEKIEKVKEKLFEGISPEQEEMVNRMVMKMIQNIS